MKQAINYKERITKDFEEWKIFLDELLLNIINQNAGEEDFWEFIFCCWVSIQKAGVVDDEFYKGLTLHQIKMGFIMGYPEISFNRNYITEMQEVKVYV